MATKRKSTLTELLQVRMTKEDLKLLRKCAKLKGMSVSQWCRHMLMRRGFGS